MPAKNDNRLLTDEDIEAIADALEKRVTDRFYGNLGQGVWSLVWKALVIAIAGLVAYGSLKK